MKSMSMISLLVVIVACSTPVTRRPVTIYPPPCGSHVDCYNQALHKLVEARDLIRQADASLMIVGAVVPFFLSPTEISAMDPVWVPADGRLLLDAQSPFNGKQLPDLRGRVPLGASAKDDITGSGPAVETPLTSSVSVTATTSGANITAIVGRVQSVGPPEYTIDSYVDEASRGNHTHSVPIVIDLPPPPHRRLVFMIRVRPFAP